MQNRHAPFDVAMRVFAHECGGPNCTTPAGNNAIDPPRYPDRSDPPQPVRVEEQLTYAQRGTVAPV